MRGKGTQEWCEGTSSLAVHAQDPLPQLRGELSLICSPT